MLHYQIYIVQYRGNQGCYARYDQRRIDSLDEALTEVNALARRTGKCFAIFKGNEPRPVHETSRYYAALNLPRQPDADRFDVV